MPPEGAALPHGTSEARLRGEALEALPSGGGDVASWNERSEIEGEALEALPPEGATLAPLIEGGRDVGN